MHYSKIAMASLLFAAACSLSSATFVFGASTLTLGGTAYVLTAPQVAVATAAVAGVVIAKKALLLAYLSSRRNGRGKRELPASLDFAPMFDAIDKQDTADCGKLVVCHSFAVDEAKRTSEEQAIVEFFDDLTVIQPNSFGKYQWAAYAGTFKQPTICFQRYGKCPVKVEALSNLVNFQ